ncbi:hypothetical protein B0H12DRAFT_1231677 [Mycena haematopus]|nr:hypothetical protein B0H12DRAFT_1231677 [Mycena haematopus]
MCEGMARVGNGVCMLVGEEETTFTGKIARMLKVAKTPPISNISVDWGHRPSKEKVVTPPDYDDFEMVEEVAVKEKKKETLNIFDESIDDLIQLDSTPAPPPPPVNLFPNIRLNVYAILQGKTIPKTVTIRGTTASGASIELPITVALSHLQNAPGAPPAIHALAARKIIQDLEDGKHALAATLANPTIRTSSSAQSRRASFGWGKPTLSCRRTRRSSPSTSRSPGMTSPAYVAAAPPSPPSVSFQPSRRPQFQTKSFRCSWRPARAPPTTSPAYAPCIPPAPQSSVSFGSGLMCPDGLVALQLFHRGSSHLTPQSPLLVTGRGVVRASSRPRSRRSPSLAPPHLHRFSPIVPSLCSVADSISLDESGYAPLQPLQLQKSHYTPPSQPSPAYALQSAYSPSPNSPQDRVSTDPLEALARLQSFDGCFSLEILAAHLIALKPNVDIHAIRAVFPAGTPDGVIASVLAMAFLANKLGAGVERDSWEGIYEKAQQYVEVALQKMGATETAEVLEAKVVPLLA